MQYKIFTIGYEGRTLQDYLNLLIKNKVACLVDVRKNPISRKRGFSKTALAASVTASHIEYIPIQKLGIESYKRKNLKTAEDYNILFAEYKKTVLPQNQESIERLYQIFLSKKRIALTCFERQASMCHRHCVAAALANLIDARFSSFRYESEDL